MWRPRLTRCRLTCIKVEASFKSGVLELSLPKRKKANRRKVEVK
ncbi:MAG: hypothetical protein U5L98_13060 [Halomonas sp.]|nr:hypothetical protein [Halomonas sp.]MDZ7853537.1 hypothetical protein [Halomonas sp.]